MTTTTWAAWEATRHDPLRSRWRILISRIVNEPEINKTQAKVRPSPLLVRRRTDRG